MEPLIIEILDRFGKLKERHRIESFPCTIGRDYNNNIIIDDPYISPSHMIITQIEDHYLVKDNNSMNGVFSLHPVKKQQTILIEDNSRIRIGHTDIRFRFTDHQFKNTVEERGKPSQISMLITNGFILPIVWLIFSSAFMLNTYIEELSPVTFQKLLGQTLPLIIFMTIWAMAWSVVSKIVTHRFYFAFHAIWISCLTLANIIFDNLTEYVEFSFALGGSAYFIGLIFSLVITGFLFYGHLHYSTPFSAKKSKLISLLAAVTIIGMIETFSLLNTADFSNSPKYSAIIKPSMFLFTRPDSIDGFFSNVKGVKTNIDSSLKHQSRDTR